MMIHHNKFNKMENPQLPLVMIMNFWTFIYIDIYIRQKCNRKITHNFPTSGGSKFQKPKRTSIPTSNFHMKPKGNSGRPTSTVHLPLEADTCRLAVGRPETCTVHSPNIDITFSIHARQHQWETYPAILENSRPSYSVHTIFICNLFGTNTYLNPQ